MTVMALMTAVLAAGGADVIWLEAREVGDGIEVTEAGTYWVWAWAPGDKATTLTLAGDTFEVQKKGKKESRYDWIRVGKRDLEPGTVSVALGTEVAAVALSLDAKFSPAKAMGDRRVSDQPEPVRDRRAETVRHTDTILTMPAFDSVEAWEGFAAKLRRRILLSSGLWPLPDRTPLNATISDRVTHEDYTVEKVHFEVRPGFLATGNLYRPVGEGRFPGVACPHGHWEHGRLESIERGSIPGRCITLARMGCVAFSYDMIGYNDSCQFKQHRWVKDCEKLWGIHPFAFQLWTSMRVIDFLQGLPDVDPGRIACTGASGGGTQTFALMAVDPRVKVAAPVNMISCSMQGGCICENAPIIRLDNSNQEVGALMAPRPLLLISATGDWTRETPRVEFPAIRSIYELYGAADRVANVHIDAEHNYNQASREAMYRFFGKWLLGEEDKYADFSEPPFEVEPVEALRVFPDGPPEGYPAQETIIAQTIEANRAKWDAILPKSDADLAAFREDYGPALSLVLGAETPEANAIAPERPGFEERGDCVVERWVLHVWASGAAIPAILYRPAEATPRDAVLLVHGDGKAAFASAAGPGPLVAGLVAQGKAVMTIDPFLVGEHHSPWQETKRRRIGSFMDTFQPTDTGYRVQDVLTALAYLRFRRDLTDAVDVVGLGEAGMWCLLACAIDGQVRRTVVDANQFDVSDDQAWVDTYYVPCIRSIGDVTTAAAMIAPRRLAVLNTGDAFDTAGMEQVYRAVGSDGLTVTQDAVSTDAILSWLQ